MKFGELKIGQKVVLKEDGPIYTVKRISACGFNVFITYQFDDGPESGGQWIDICYLKKSKSKGE